MKTKTLFLSTILLMMFMITLNAQDEPEMGADPGPGSVTVYSEDGENFTLYLNGDRKNATPTSRVVAENITEVPVAFRIVFENNTSPELKKKGLRGGANCLYSIEKNKKGERVLKIKDCTSSPTVVSNQPAGEISEPSVTSTPVSKPAQLSAKYSNGIITINDGRTLSVKKVKANGMTYPRVKMTALHGAQVTVAYDNSDEKSTAESPFQYEVKDFTNNNAYFTLTVDEGGPEKTWYVKLQNSNGYDLTIE